MSRFVIEAATEAHEPELRRLFAESEMDGEIKISFRREPNFFLAPNVLAPFCQVMAARDCASGAIAGVATRSVRPSFINGKPEPLGYLADLRLDRRYRGGPLLAQAYRQLKQLHRDGRAKIYFTVIAEGNRLALETIAAGRAGLPPYRDYGRLLVPAVNLRRRKAPVAGLEIRRGTRALLAEIVGCLDRNHRRRQFAPCYRIDHFGGLAENSAGSLRAFRIEDFYAAVRKNRIVGVLGKWDQSEYKQTVVTGYGKKTSLLRPAYNLAARLTGSPTYPGPGRGLRFFHASFIAVDEDDVDVFRALLRRLYNDHVGTDYHYFIVGLHEKDPLGAALSDYSLTPFAARLFLVHFDDGEEIFKSLDAARPPYIEAALL